MVERVQQAGYAHPYGDQYEQPERSQPRAPHTRDQHWRFGQFMAATEQLAHVNQQDYGRTLNAVLIQLQTTSVLVLVCLPLAGLCILIGSLLFAREL